MRVKRLGMTVLAGCILLFGALNVVLVLQVHISTLEADIKDAAAEWQLSALHSLYFTSARSLLPFSESNSFLISPGASTSEEQEQAGLTENDDDDEEDDAGSIQEPELPESQPQADLEEDDLQALLGEGDWEGEELEGGEEDERGGEAELEAAAERPAEAQEVREAGGGAAVPAAAAAEVQAAAVRAQQASKIVRERTLSRRVNERKKAVVAPVQGTTKGGSATGRGKGVAPPPPPPPPPAPVAKRKGQTQKKKKRPRP